MNTKQQAAHQGPCWERPFLDPVRPDAHVVLWKRRQAVAYLRASGIYVLDQGSKAPAWGHGPKAAV